MLACLLPGTQHIYFFLNMLSHYMIFIMLPKISELIWGFCMHEFQWFNCTWKNVLLSQKCLFLILSDYHCSACKYLIDVYSDCIIIVVSIFNLKTWCSREWWLLKLSKHCLLFCKAYSYRQFSCVNILFECLFYRRTCLKSHWNFSVKNNFKWKNFMIPLYSLNLVPFPQASKQELGHRDYTCTQSRLRCNS